MVEEGERGEQRGKVVIARTGQSTAGSSLSVVKQKAGDAPTALSAVQRRGDALTREVTTYSSQMWLGGCGDKQVETSWELGVPDVRR